MKAMIKEVLNHQKRKHSKTKQFEGTPPNTKVL